MNIIGRGQTTVTPTDNDSLSKQKGEKKQVYFSPRKASIMSALLPGLGQVYNGKYYKVFIIYGLGAAAGYIFQINNQEYLRYSEALRYSVDHGGLAEIDGRTYTTDNLLEIKKDYKKTRDFAILGMGIIYLLNIVDANVDAHLKTFDISDDLGLQILPWHGIYSLGRGAQIAGGLTLKLKLK